MQKKSINKILSIFVILLLGIIVYLVFSSRGPKPYEGQAPSVTSDSEKPIDWENKISDIRKVIGSEFLGTKIEESYSLGIFQKGDITGDGAEEALVDLGSGGAYVSSLVLMQMENSKPTIARFKQKDGEISPLMFLAGASVMNGESAVLLSEQQAIYAGHWERDNSSSSGALAICTVEVYQWNKKTKTFDFNENLNKEVQTEFCRKAEQLPE